MSNWHLDVVFSCSHTAIISRSTVWTVRTISLKWASMSSKASSLVLKETLKLRISKKRIDNIKLPKAPFRAMFSKAFRDAMTFSQLNACWGEKFSDSIFPSQAPCPCTSKQSLSSVCSRWCALLRLSLNSTQSSADSCQDDRSLLTVSETLYYLSAVNKEV